GGGLPPHAGARGPHDGAEAARRTRASALRPQLLRRLEGWPYWRRRPLRGIRVRGGRCRGCAPQALRLSVSRGRTAALKRRANRAIGSSGIPRSTRNASSDRPLLTESQMDPEVGTPSRPASPRRRRWPRRLVLASLGLALT